MKDVATTGDFELGPIIGMMMVVMVLAVVMQAFQPLQPPPGLYGCPYCPDTFNTIEELVTHVAEAHPDKPPLELVDIIWE